MITFGRMFIPTFGAGWEPGDGPFSGWSLDTSISPMEFFCPQGLFLQHSSDFSTCSSVGALRTSSRWGADAGTGLGFSWRSCVFRSWHGIWGSTRCGCCCPETPSKSTTADSDGRQLNSASILPIFFLCPAPSADALNPLPLEARASQDTILSPSQVLLALGARIGAPITTVGAAVTFFRNSAQPPGLSKNPRIPIETPERKRQLRSLPW